MNDLGRRASFLGRLQRVPYEAKPGWFPREIFITLPNVICLRPDPSLLWYYLRDLCLLSFRVTPPLAHGCAHSAYMWKKGWNGRGAILFESRVPFLPRSGGGDVQMTVVNTSQDSKLVGCGLSTCLEHRTPQRATGSHWRQILGQNLIFFFHLGQNKLPFPLSLLRIAQLPVFKEINSYDFLTLSCWMGALWHSPQRVLGFGSSGDEGPHLRALLGPHPLSLSSPNPHGLEGGPILTSRWLATVSIWVWLTFLPLPFPTLPTSGLPWWPLLVSSGCSHLDWAGLSPVWWGPNFPRPDISALRTI